MIGLVPIRDLAAQDTLNGKNQRIIQAAAAVSRYMDDPINKKKLDRFVTVLDTYDDTFNRPDSDFELLEAEKAKLADALKEANAMKSEISGHNKRMVLELKTAQKQLDELSVSYEDLHGKREETNEALETTKRELENVSRVSGFVARVKLQLEDANHALKQQVMELQGEIRVKPEGGPARNDEFDELPLGLVEGHSEANRVTRLEESLTGALESLEMLTQKVLAEKKGNPKEDGQDDDDGSVGNDNDIAIEAHNALLKEEIETLRTACTNHEKATKGLNAALGAHRETYKTLKAENETLASQIARLEAQIKEEFQDADDGGEDEGADKKNENDKLKETIAALGKDKLDLASKIREEAKLSDDLKKNWDHAATARDSFQAQFIECRQKLTEEKTKHAEETKSLRAEIDALRSENHNLLEQLSVLPAAEQGDGGGYVTPPKAKEALVAACLRDEFFSPPDTKKAPLVALANDFFNSPKKPDEAQTVAPSIAATGTKKQLFPDSTPQPKSDGPERKRDALTRVVLGVAAAWFPVKTEHTDEVVDAPVPTPPVPDQSKPDQSKPDQPKPDQSKPDQAKPDQPKTDQPKTDQPKLDQPKPDQPKPDQPIPNPSILKKCANPTTLKDSSLHKDDPKDPKRTRTDGQKTVEARALWGVKGTARSEGRRQIKAPVRIGASGRRNSSA